jgi:hypothetical protein
LRSCLLLSVCHVSLVPLYNDQRGQRPPNDTPRLLLNRIILALLPMTDCTFYSHRNALPPSQTHAPNNVKDNTTDHTCFSFFTKETATHQTTTKHTIHRAKILLPARDMRDLTIFNACQANGFSRKGWCQVHIPDPLRDLACEFLKLWSNSAILPLQSLRMG